MKIAQQKNKKNKKPLYFALGIILAALVLVVTLELTRATDFIKNPFYQPSAEELEQKRIDEANKADSTHGSKEDLKPNPNVDETKNTSEIPVDTSGTISITTLSQSNGQVNFTATVSDNLSDNGTCTVTFSNTNARPVTRTITASNHTCGPQSIPETEFSTLGTWQVTARYFSNNTQVTTTSSVEIK